MEYIVEILWTVLYLYVIGGTALLIGSVAVYGLAVSIYYLLVWLATQISHVLARMPGHVDFPLKRHHTVR